MGPVTALNVRRIGLVLEALCMFGMLSEYRKQAAVPALAFGVPLYRIFQVGLGLGLALWCIGTISYRWAKQKGDV